MYGRFPSNMATVAAVHLAESGIWKPDKHSVADVQPWDGYTQAFLEEAAWTWLHVAAGVRTPEIVVEYALVFPSGYP